MSDFIFISILLDIHSYIEVVKKKIKLLLQTNNSNDITGCLPRKENLCNPTSFAVI